MRGLAHSKRSTAPSNGMDAKSSAGVPLLSPAAAQRCAEGAGLDSGAAAAAQSAMPSIAAPCHRTDRQSFFTNAAAPAAPQLQSRISTSLTDVTQDFLNYIKIALAYVDICLVVGAIELVVRHYALSLSRHSPDYR